MDSNDQLQAVQAQINTLQEQLNMASQVVAQANQVYQDLSVNSKYLNMVVQINSQGVTLEAG